MRAGSLRDVVAIMRGVRTKDEFGAENVSWVCVGTPRCDARDVSGGVAERRVDIAQKVTKEFRFRLRTNLRVGDRIYYKDLKYNVIYIGEDGKLMMMTVTTELIIE